MVKSTDETNIPKEDNQKISPAELVKRKKEMTDYWKEQQFFLNAQVGYLKARNAVTEQMAVEEELELRRMIALMRIAQITAPPEQAPEENVPNGPDTEMVQPEEGVPKEPMIRRRLKTEIPQ